MLKLIVTALMLVMVFYEADGFVFWDSLKEEINDDGMRVKYCELDGKRYEIGDTWISNCVKCDCGGIMSCQGIGYNGGAFSFENCSMVKMDDCCYQFFRDDDPTVPCFEKICPEEA